MSDDQWTAVQALRSMIDDEEEKGWRKGRREELIAVRNFLPESQEQLITYMSNFEEGTEEYNFLNGAIKLGFRIHKEPVPPQEGGVKRRKTKRRKTKRRKTKRRKNSRL